jgi:hypothetical protein
LPDRGQAAWQLNFGPVALRQLLIQAPLMGVLITADHAFRLPDQCS